MNRLFIIAMASIMLVGCAIPPARLAQPTIEINDVMNVKLQEQLIAFELDLNKRINKRVVDAKYPSWAQIYKMEADVEFEVRAYGFGKYQIERIATVGDALFDNYAEEAVRHSLQRIWMDESLRDVNFKLRVSVAYRL